ncbi:MAG TPA: hypothetical protein VGA56_25955 [Opitutaceae bacterium]
MDFAPFASHLGTKCSEECFLAGRPAWLRGDLEQAEVDWRSVFPILQRIPWQESGTLLVTPGRQSAFEFGDGMREIALIVDIAARCANVLRMLAHCRSGRVVRSTVSGTPWESLPWPGIRIVARKHWRTGLGELYRSFSKAAFVRALQRLVPEISAEQLEPDGAGIRARACGRDGKLLDDFCIIEDGNAIHVCNAPSPAATASLAIGTTFAGKVV